MLYEWDDPKNATNRRKHGISFELMAEFDWSLSILIDVQWVENEERELTVGPIGSSLYAVVTTERKAIRVISLRPADTDERQMWKKEFQNG